MKTIEVSAAIIKDADKILATQRGYGEFKGGWEFPGGKLEPGETPEQAAIREIKEELEVNLIIDRFVTTVDYDYEQFHLTMHCFLSHLENESITLTEHEAAAWLTPAHVDEVNWLPADVLVIQALREQEII